MLQYGTQITQLGDPLQKISPERLFIGISRPKPAFRDLIGQLRMVQSIDLKQYRELKKQLPYFVCGIFHPAIRRREHFASIQYFVLDLDHLAEAELDKAVLAGRLRESPELMMCFASPGDDGLKLLFNLSEPCADAELFSAFYKLFARRFAESHGLERVLDYRTSDVTRACFLSYDPDAYFNPEAEPVELQKFIPDLSFDQAEKDLKAADAFLKNQTLQKESKENEQLDADVLLRIKQKLNPDYRRPHEKQQYVPPQVDKMLPELQEGLEAFEMKILETAPIHYGRKIRLACRELWAELNIFYGKRGFRVVPTTKSGSNAELAALAARAVEEILDGGRPTADG